MSGDMSSVVILFCFRAIVIGTKYHDEGIKGRMSELLSEASWLLSSPSTTTSNPTVNSSRSSTIPQAAINETLRHAEGKFIRRALGAIEQTRTFESGIWPLPA